MSSFNSIVNIDRIKIDNNIAYIYIKILSPYESEIHKPYVFCTENLKTGDIYFSNLNIYWIDRYKVNESDEKFSAFNPDAHISIRRNKTICLRLNLLNGSFEGGRMVLRVRLHMKDYIGPAISNQNVWSSDVITLASSELFVPDMKCLAIKALSDKTICAIKFIHKNAESHQNFYAFITPKIYFMDRSGSIQLAESSYVDTYDSNTDIFIFSTNKTYTSRNITINAELYWSDETLAKKQKFTVDTMNSFNAYYADDFSLHKCFNLIYLDDSPKKILGIFAKKY